MSTSILQINVDLEPVKFCLIKKKGWSLKKADLVGELYVKFLRLIQLYPEKSIVPTQAIDEMWHMHILDTRKYQTDCHDLFGGFIHHFPYYGVRNSDDELAMKESFSETVILFQKHFGVSPYINNDESIEQSMRPASCDDFCTSCDTGNCNAGIRRVPNRVRPNRLMVSELC
jgi:hypothetical protein